MKKILAVLVVGVGLAGCGPKTGDTSGGAKPASGAIAPGRVDPLNVPEETKLRASRGAKEGVLYQNALAAVYAPDDQKEFSAYDEYGWKSAGNYKTYGAFPAGWWVYSAPYWVIWDLKNGQRGE